MKRIIFVFCVLFCLNGFAQNRIGINEPNVDASAVLQMTSSNKGMLIPRMTSGQRINLDSPANGLLVYETTSRIFWYYSGVGWSRLIKNRNKQDGIGDADTDTRIFLEYTNDNDQIRLFQKGIEYFRLQRNRFEFRNIGNSVFIGDSAGLNDDKKGNNNTFIGTSSGESTFNGKKNVAVGYQSLKLNVNEDDNVAIGSYAMLKGVSARRNVALGKNTLRNNKTEDSHIAIGSGALQNHITGSNCLGIGVNSLVENTTGSLNTTIGNNSLSSNKSSNRNVAIGHEAGRLSVNGSNIYLGYHAGGQNMFSFRLFIDNSDTQAPLIGGNFNSNEVIIRNNLTIAENLYYEGRLITTSDRRLKKNIKKVKAVLPRLIQLNTYTYNLKNSADQKKQYGLIAQEVQTIFPLLVNRINPDNDYIGVNYMQFIPLLLEAEKEQFKQLKKLGEEIKNEETELTKLEDEIIMLKELVAIKASK